MAPFWRLMMWILALKKQRPTDQRGSSTPTTALVILTDADAPQAIDSSGLAALHPDICAALTSFKDM
jgi:hypothetical protein